MISNKNVLPECHADSLLVQLITQRGFPRHLKGKDNVDIELGKLKDIDDIVIGMVDSDKFTSDIKYKNIELFSEVVVDSIHLNGLLLRKIPNNNKYIIFIHPEFEPWILNQAAEAGIEINNYGYNSLGDIIRAAKDHECSENRNFKKFVNAVVLSNPNGIQLLRKWIVDNNFS